MYIALSILSCLATIFFLKIIAYHPGAMVLAALFSFITYWTLKRGFDVAEFHRKSEYVDPENITIFKEKRPQKKWKYITRSRLRLMIFSFIVVYFAFGFIRFSLHYTTKILSANSVQILIFLLICAILIPFDD